MAKRSKVKLFEQIRRAHERDGASIRELARRFGVHRRDVRAALASPVPPARKAAEVPRPSPKLDEWKPLIDRWLADDEEVPRKQRHTARRVWQRLVLEHGADIGESTVRRYVKAVKDARAAPLVEVMIVQDHELGAEAEVDFGAVHVWLAGELVQVALFVMRLSASGRSFARAYLNEAQEVFLDGHVRAFDHFGGTPGRVRYDNLKAAVVKVLKGRDRDESERFVAMRSHYGFDSFFCAPGIGGAHEKGGVEGEVGRFRRRHLVPVPKVASMAELNELILAGCVIDDGRLIGHRRMSIGDHFLLEAPTLRALPIEVFDSATMSNHRVDTKARVSVRSVHYSVPARLARRRVDVRIGADSIKILDANTVVAVHARGRKGEQVLALDHYLEVLAYKPGALPGATALAAARTSGAFTSTHDRFWAVARRRLGDQAGTRALIEVLLAHRTLPTPAVIEGISRALTAGSVDPAVVLLEARRCIEPEPIAAVIPIGGHSLTPRPPPTLTAYDDLLENTP
jgi:transposase